MTDQEITRAKQRQYGADYRARIRAQLSTEVICWHPIPGPELPDDEIRVLIQIGFDDEAEICPAYLLAGEWYYINDDPCCCDPVGWSHMPAGISAAKHQLMLHAQHRGHPGRPRKTKTP